MRNTIRLFVLIVCLTAAVPFARAEPASGFMMQGQMAANLVVAPGISTYVGDFSILPSLRLGAQFRPLAVALEINYSTFATSQNSRSDGFHVISLGPNIQPVVWRSVDGNVRLSPVIGFSFGGVLSNSSSGTSSSSDHYLVGAVNGALLANYFMHRNFGLGVEGGVRAQFVSISSGGNGTSNTLYTVAAIYVALSLTFVAGS